MCASGLAASLRGPYRHCHSPSAFEAGNARGHLHGRCGRPGEAQNCRACCDAAGDGALRVPRRAAAAVSNQHRLPRALLCLHGRAAVWCTAPQHVCVCDASTLDGAGAAGRLRGRQLVPPCNRDGLYGERGTLACVLCACVRTGALFVIHLLPGNMAHCQRAHRSLLRRKVLATRLSVGSLFPGFTLLPMPSLPLEWAVECLSHCSPPLLPLHTPRPLHGPRQAAPRNPDFNLWLGPPSTHPPPPPPSAHPCAPSTPPPTPMAVRQSSQLAPPPGPPAARFLSPRNKPGRATRLARHRHPS